MEIDKKNFEAFTGLPPLKKSVIQLCGKEFVDRLRHQGIYTQDDEFWIEVNKHLNIPANAYAIQHANLKAEKERKREEEAARDKAERERLLANKEEIVTKNRKGWTITVFELPHSDKYGKKFIAECRKEGELHKTTSFAINPNEAYTLGAKFVDDFQRIQGQIQEAKAKERLLKNLYLILIYLSGEDEHNLYLQGYGYKHKMSKENFLGLSFWQELDLNIISELKLDRFLEMSKTKKALLMNKKGMKQARELLKSLDFDGVETILKRREYHEEYINYQDPENL